ncbi:MAG TPA: S9 family peptidase [Usitatibacteraceae bacterium]|nr:S9 family peptidase [Usitatibacteraceae bacterium]
MRMPLRLAAVAALAAAALACRAQGEVLTPPASLVLDGVPPIPAEIAAKTGPYAAFRPSTLLDWHPARRELLVRQRLGDTEQLHRVAEPGRPPEPLTDLPEAIAAGRYEPREARWLLLTRGTGGDEAFGIHRYDAATRQGVSVSPAGLRASVPEWNHAGDRIVYTTVPIDRNSAARVARTTVHLADPADPGPARVLAELPGGGWRDFQFSPDDRRLAFVEYVSAEESHVWLMDVATGKRRRLTPATRGEPVFYESPNFTADGKALYVLSDRGSEYRHVARIDIATKRERALAANLKFDVEEIALSSAAGRLAFVTNEAGSHVLRFLDLATRKETPRPALVPGVISTLRWRKDGSEIAFTHASSRSPGDVFSYDLGANRVTRWTNGNSPALNAATFPEPRTIHWKSFDGREITGLYYHPPSRFEGVRPVVVIVHGGPASQARAGFIGRNNYLVNELGAALVYPNVRGSSGFGKTFLKLDNGRRREDSVKDLGALLDWIGAQPGLDAGRVLVMGGSYGGYMALAASVAFADRIAGSVSIVGISNFVTFLERTETYRRDLRRVEYGDERDPAMRAFLDSISPLTRADRIAKPLFVVQGRNDPRVPWTESEQLVAALKKRGTPVWYLLANDEGHGFRRKANADFQFNATVEFIRRTLH